MRQTSEPITIAHPMRLFLSPLIEIGRFPSWLHGAKRMDHRVFQRTPPNTIAENRA
jgi:hypothetical protein